MLLHVHDVQCSQGNINSIALSLIRGGGGGEGHPPPWPPRLSHFGQVSQGGSGYAGQGDSAGCAGRGSAAGGDGDSGASSSTAHSWWWLGEGERIQRMHFLFLLRTPQKKKKPRKSSAI